MAELRQQAGRIAVFFPSLSGGGLERVMLTLANGFITRGVGVDLVQVKRGGAYEDQVHPGVRRIDLGARSLRSSLLALAAYLRREKPEVLLSALTGANVAAILARRLALTHTRVVLTQHGTVRHRSWAGGNHRSSLSRPLIPWVFRRADKVVAVSKGLAGELREITGLPPERVVTIYNPVIPPNLPERVSEDPGHPRLTPGQERVILGAGRFVPSKDFPTLLRAFSRVRRREAARLVILGEGPERARLEQMARELGVEQDVAFPGFVQNPYAWMARSAAFVLSSMWEGFGNVLVEAIACGTPAISTDCPHGPGEILDGGRYGELVPVSDDVAMADAILRVLSGHRHPVPPAALKPFTLEAALDSYLRVMGFSVPFPRPSG